MIAVRTLSTTIVILKTDVHAMDELKIFLMHMEFIVVYSAFDKFVIDAQFFFEK